jgi:hypothetical protein
MKPIISTITVFTSALAPAAYVVGREEPGGTVYV